MEIIHGLAVSTLDEETGLALLKLPRLQLQTSYGGRIRDQLGLLLVLAGRIALGVGLGLFSTTISVAVAWGLFIFSGSQSLVIWTAVLIFSAGVGAGAGSLLAWLQLDRGNNPERVVTAITVVAISMLSAWIGYYYGSNREIECCAMRTVTPVYYTALGATLGANLAVVTTSLFRGSIERRRRTRIQNGVV